MKRITIFLALWAFSLNLMAASRPIVKLTIRGGTGHPDGSVTYNRVEQELVGKTRDLHVKCLGEGPNKCIVSSQVNHPSVEVDAYDVHIANQMIAAFHQQLSSGQHNGSLSRTFMDPAGNERLYLMTWTQVVLSDGTLEYQMELVRF